MKYDFQPNCSLIVFKTWIKTGLEVGRGVMIDQMEGIAVTADN